MSKIKQNIFSRDGLNVSNIKKVNLNYGKSNLLQ